MGVVAVNAAGGEQTEQMQGAVVRLAVVDRLVHRFILKEIAVLNGLGDAGELLIDDAARAHVGVADLAVTHLTVRQAYVKTRRADHGNGILEEQLVKMRRARIVDGVAVLRSDTKTVHNNQCNWFFHIVVLSV